MNIKKSLYTIPVASTCFTKEAFFDGKGSRPAIKFTYEKDGKSYLDGISFKQISALRHRVERCCTPWHIESAYDNLVEIESSTWLSEIQRDTQEFWRNKLSMHHYMIYLDSSGCFEVIAESWEALSGT